MELAAVELAAVELAAVELAAVNKKKCPGRSWGIVGAEERTRTSTVLLPLDP